MKQIMSLIAITLVSTATFAGAPTSGNSATISALGAAWKHQAPVSVGNHNLVMVGGQDISSRPMLDGPITAA